VSELGIELARALVSAIRGDPALRGELRELLGVEGIVRPDGPESRRWLTVPEAAERLGCSADAVRMRCSRGRLEHRRQGRRLYVSAASVDELGRDGVG
jgi:excisionase family DNA binding protein